MPTLKRTATLTLPAVQWCSLLAVLYTFLIFTIPANRATMRTYHLSPLEYRVILFAIAIPSLLVWFAAFWGYAALTQYAQSIKKTPEGPHFKQLAKGVTWLAWSLPVSSIISIVLNGIATITPSFHPAAIITNNYIGLLIPLVAFTVIGTATRGLLVTSKLSFTLHGTRLITFAFLTAGVLYCFLTFRRFDLTSLGSHHNPYFLPIWLMVISVTIPYLYAWFIGLLSSYELSIFRKHTPGLLYRRALGYLAFGMIAVLASSIAMQYINGIQPRIGHLVFDYRLIVNTIFRIIGGIGYIFLAIGANRLKKIEEV